MNVIYYFCVNRRNNTLRSKTLCSIRDKIFFLLNALVLIVILSAPRVKRCFISSVDSIHPPTVNGTNDLRESPSTTSKNNSLFFFLSTNIKKYYFINCPTIEKIYFCDRITDRHWMLKVYTLNKFSVFVE